MSRILFTNCHLVVDEYKEYLNGAILVDGPRIEEVFPHADRIGKILGNYDIVDLSKLTVMPGFFDSHTHGVKGIDFDKSNSIDEASRIFAKNGTTSFFCTLTNNENLCNELSMIENIDTRYANFLGVHIEGPFINPNKSGALAKEDIKPCSINLLDSILKSNVNIKQMTIAPELENINFIVDELRDYGIKVMLGHSNAKIKDVNIQYDGYTHLFNAMSGFDHRDLGLVNMALNNDDKYVEIIADGIHVDRSVLSIVTKLVPVDRLILISDSTLAAGLNDGEYVFQGVPCIKEGISFKRKDSTIAGSAAFLADGVKMMHKLGATYTELLQMSSLNALRFYGLDKLRGTLKKGMFADLVVLDDELNVVFSYVKGKVVRA